jgi:hypothetical protein
VQIKFRGLQRLATPFMGLRDAGQHQARLGGIRIGQHAIKQGPRRVMQTMVGKLLRQRDPFRQLHCRNHRPLYRKRSGDVDRRFRAAGTQCQCAQPQIPYRCRHTIRRRQALPVLQCADRVSHSFGERPQGVPRGYGKDAGISRPGSEHTQSRAWQFCFGKIRRQPDLRDLLRFGVTRATCEIRQISAGFSRFGGAPAQGKFQPARVIAGQQLVAVGRGGGMADVGFPQSGGVGIRGFRDGARFCFKQLFQRSDTQGAIVLTVSRLKQNAPPRRIFAAAQRRARLHHRVLRRDDTGMQTQTQLGRTAFIEQGQPGHGFTRQLEVEQGVDKQPGRGGVQRAVILLETQHAAKGIVSARVANVTLYDQQAQFTQSAGTQSGTPQGTSRVVTGDRRTAEGERSPGCHGM